MIKHSPSADPDAGHRDSAQPVDEPTGVDEAQTGRRRRWEIIVLVAVAIAVVALEASAYHRMGLFEVSAGWLWALAGVAFVVLGSVEITRAGIDDFLPYFFPGYRLIRSASKIDALDSTTGPTLFYMDINRWERSSTHGHEAGETRIITFEDPYHRHRMIGWGVTGE